MEQAPTNTGIISSITTMTLYVFNQIFSFFSKEDVHQIVMAVVVGTISFAVPFLWKKITGNKKKDKDETKH